MEFNIDYGSVRINQPSTQATLFASVDGRAASLGGGEVVFYDPSTDRNHVMTLQVLQALDLCREFQPLELHAENVATKVEGLRGQSAAVRKVLEGLASRGLMLSADAFLQRYEATPAIDLAPCSGVFVRACDRPEQLQQLLASLLEQCKSFSLPAPLVLLDDSRDPAAANRHQQLLREFSERSGETTRYVGAEQWQHLVQSIGQAVGSTALAPLLSRPARYRGRSGGGIGKNLISLLSAGGRYFLLDDDFVLPLHRHPQHAAGLVADGSGWGIRTYPAMQTALDAGSRLEQDPFAMHLQWCGQRLGPLLAGTTPLRLDRAALRGTAPSRNALLRPEARISATVNGHRGGSGAFGLAWLYLLDPVARAGLCEQPERYAELVGDPPVWWGCQKFQLGAGGNFTPFAIDNAQLTPPTSPFGRGEDALFTALTRLLHADSVQLDVPYAIAHCQESGRDRSDSLTKPETPDINHCLAQLARDASTELFASDPAQRLRGFAARLDDLAAGDDAELVSYLREFLLHRRSTLIEQLQQVAQVSSDAPQAWREDLNRVIEANGRAMLDRDPPRFAGWSVDASNSDCAAALRTETQVLAAGLRDWDSAWQLAREQSSAWLDKLA